MTKRKDEKIPKPAANKTYSWRFLAWALLFIFISVYWLNVFGKPEVQTLPYTELKEKIRQGNVKEVTLKGQEITGIFKIEGDRKEDRDPKRFLTIKPNIDDPELLRLLEGHGVAVRAEEEEPSPWVQMLIGFLPWILIIGFIFYINKKMQERMGGGAGMGGMFGFGRSRAKRFRKGPTDVSFGDVAGLENAKRDLREVIDYLKEPERYRELGAKIPKGILLTGPPGIGKTLLARAVAGEAEVPFYSISGSEFIEMFVGIGAARVRDMFESARKEAPAIIFIDEIDSVGRTRGTGLGGGHDEREQTLNQILSMMDGFLAHETVVVLAATNRPDVLDPALLRPGRFDRKIPLDLPQKKAREQILKVHTRRVPLAEDVDLKNPAKRTIGFSGADLENLVNEAALLAGREKLEKVDRPTFERARDKIILGGERESMISEEEKRIIANHESGHTLVAYLLPDADPLEKVTILARGKALGVTEQIPEEDRHILNRSYLLSRLTVLLAGRAAEKLTLGEISSGAANDLNLATTLARRMICQWGMSETLGPVAYPQGEEHIFLGRELTQQRNFSEHSARLIDEEIRSLIRTVEDQAEKLLKKERKKLEALSEALLEKETLQADEIERVLERA